MLTPRSDDTNRKALLKDREKNPHKWGNVTPKQLPSDWSGTDLAEVRKQEDIIEQTKK